MPSWKKTQLIALPCPAHACRVGLPKPTHLGSSASKKELGSIQGTWVGKGEGWEQLRVQKLEIWGWGCLGPALGPWSCLAPSPLGLCPNPAHDQPPQLAPCLRNPLNFL